MMLAVFSSTFQGTMPSLLPSLFYTEVRYGALAVTYNISASIFGGTTPLVVSWLINLTENRLMPAYYMIFAAVVGMIVVTYFVKDTSGKSLRGSRRRWRRNRKLKRYWKSRKKPYGGGKKQIKMSHECCRIQLESVVIVLGRSGWGFTPPRFPSTRQIGANPEGSCVFCSGR